MKNLIQKKIKKIEKKLNQKPNDRFLIAQLSFLKSGLNAKKPKSTLELAQNEIFNIMK